MSGIINLENGLIYQKGVNRKMGILNYERKILKKVINHSYTIGQWIGEIKKINKPEKKKLIRKIELTQEQEKKIKSFYKKNYGKVVKPYWHKVYQSYTGRFSEKYIPEILYSTKIEPAFNDTEYRDVLDDKLLLKTFTAGIDEIETPKMIGYYCNGIFCNQNNEIISKDKLIDQILKFDKVVIKEAKDTSSGNGVKILSIDDKCDKEQIKHLLSLYDKNTQYIVQECIVQHSELSKIYKESVNTFRIMTYVLDGKVLHMPVALRLGKGGSFLDNVHAGGIFIGVDDNGFLMDNGYDDIGNTFSMHPDTGLIFKGYQITFIPKIIEVAKKMHLNAPQLGIISWDITIGSEGTLILVEANTKGQSIQLPQKSNGKPAFGENTERIFEILRKRERNE